MAVQPTLVSRIRANDDVLFQDLQGEGVLLNLKTGAYFGLDQVGTRVWQLLEQHEALSEIVAAILAEYDVPEARCAEDILALIADMEKQGLVRELIAGPP
jgi:hypothetical protein